MCALVGHRERYRIRRGRAKMRGRECRDLACPRPRAVQKLIGTAEVNRGWFGDDMIGHGQAPSDLAAADKSDGRSAGPRD